MTVLKASKSDLRKLLGAIAGEKRLIAPIADRTAVRFAEIADSAEICLEYRNPRMSARSALFPQSEVLLTFDGETATDARPEYRETVLFGVRPCDARAFTMLDRVFRWEGTDDPYYVGRREAATVVSLACNESGAACFCTSVGGAPHDETGSDVLAIDLGDDVLLRPVSERGETLLATFAPGMTEASEADLDRAAKFAEAAKAGQPDVAIPTDLEGLKKLFDSEVWEEFAMTCLGCGACTYSCPTCHCFDITDEEKRGVGYRVRSWDTCAFPLFTLHGSGHNPRPAKNARVRQRVLHKFLYCPENFEQVFCVGCGRCVTNCPTGIDIRKILGRVSQLVASG